MAGHLRHQPEQRASLEALSCTWPTMIVGAEVGSNLEQLRAAATDTVEGMPRVASADTSDGQIASKLKLEGREARGTAASYWYLPLTKEFSTRLAWPSRVTALSPKTWTSV